MSNLDAESLQRIPHPPPPSTHPHRPLPSPHPRLTPTPVARPPLPLAQRLSRFLSAPRRPIILLEPTDTAGGAGSPLGGPTAPPSALTPGASAADSMSTPLCAPLSAAPAFASHHHPAAPPPPAPGHTPAPCGVQPLPCGDGIFFSPVGVPSGDIAVEVRGGSFQWPAKEPGQGGAERSMGGALNADTGADKRSSNCSPTNIPPAGAPPSNAIPAGTPATHTAAAHAPAAHPSASASSAPTCSETATHPGAGAAPPAAPPAAPSAGVLFSPPLGPAAPPAAPPDGISPSAGGVYDLNLELRQGWLVGLAGPSGSGKSTLLQALIGEVPRLGGRVVVRGRVAYCSQEPWIQNMSLRSNVLFGEPWDPRRYAKVSKRTCAAHCRVGATCPVQPEPPTTRSV